MDQLIKKGQIKSVQNNSQLMVGLSWDIEQGQQVDLDAQCLLISEIGEIADAVYYNKLQSNCNSIIHSGDCLTGEKEGYDETIQINLAKLPEDKRYLAILICSYEGVSFKKVESSLISILGQNQDLLMTISLGALDNQWKIYNSQTTGQGKNFMECENLVKENLKFVGFDEGALFESKNWSQGSGKKFSLQKDQSIYIPQIGYNKVNIGLGWDTKCDVDASILMMDSNNQLYHNVYFGSKISPDEAVKHSGDNLTGEGEGDDEVISVNINKLNSIVTHLWCVITIYSDGYSFKDIEGCFCRLVINNKEFCRYELSNNKDGVSRGCIMCNLSKQKDGQWTIKARGYYTKNTKRSADIIPIINNIFNNGPSMYTVQTNNATQKLTQQIVQQQQQQTLDNPQNQKKKEVCIIF